MENSFFIFTEKEKPVSIERFHMCTWEFNNDSSLVEFGCEITSKSIQENSLTIFLFVPWASKSCETQDLYEKLSIAENSRFIFNDSVVGTNSLDGGRNKSGVIHTFSGRNELCVLPAQVAINEDKIITATLNLQPYHEYSSQSKPNLYFRFWIKPSMPHISMRKKGIGKSTIIYDVKINERRNIPDERVMYFQNKDFCKIKYCFSFNILPNKYDIVFFDNTSLKNVRTLEYESFNKYLGDKRVKKDELIVVFNKKEVEDFNAMKSAQSFTFFSIYSKERIGPGQIALAVLINIICGILLYIPGYRNSIHTEVSTMQFVSQLPYEIYLAVAIAITTLLYFLWPSLIKKPKRFWNWLMNYLKS